MAAEWIRALLQIYEEYVEERGNLAIQHRELRDAYNPFDLPREAFVAVFRIPQDMVLEIANTIRPRFLNQRTTALPVERQLLITLMVFAHGAYQRPAGRDWGLAVSQPTVSRCVRRVIIAMNSLLLNRWIKLPITPNEREAIRRKFAAAPQPFPNAVGAIDCTHVRIIAPRVHEEAYKNHKGYHSLNVQAICDPDLKILSVNARFPGARHDYFIWRSSRAYNLIKLLYDRGDHNAWLLGDAGYALEPWLMTPIPDAQPNTPEFRYTEAHCKARNVIERCFGVLKGTWRILGSQRSLTYEPRVAGLIVYTCCILHNMRRAINAPILEEEDFVENMQQPLGAARRVPGNDDSDDDDFDNNDDADRRRQLIKSRRIRARLINRYFVR